MPEYEIVVEPMDGYGNRPTVAVLPSDDRDREMVLRSTAMYGLDGRPIGTPEAAREAFWGVHIYDYADLELVSFVLIPGPTERLTSWGALGFEYEGVHYRGGWSSRASVFNIAGIMEPVLDGALLRIWQGKPSGGLSVAIPLSAVQRAGIRLTVEYDDGVCYRPADDYKTPGIREQEAGRVLRSADYVGTR